MRPNQSDHRFAAKLIGIALLLATVSNGAVRYLDRMVPSAQETYTAYWKARCTPSANGQLPGATNRFACARVTPEATASERPARPRTKAGDVLDILRPELLPKLVKDLLGVGFIAASVYLIAWQGAPVVNIQGAWPLMLMLGYSAMLLFVSIFFNGVFIAFAGARSMIFLLFAMVGQWFARHIDYLAKCVGALLVIEALLMFAEVLHGAFASNFHFHFPLNMKPSGTLVLSNSAGIFAAAALAFYHAFAPARPHFGILVFLALAMVLMTGSATGILCMSLFLFTLFMGNVRVKWRVPFAFGCVASGAGLFLFLPEITGRPDLFVNSLGERLHKFFAVLLERDVIQTIFGSGLGFNTNASLNLFGHGKVFSNIATAQAAAALPADSTVTSLIIQIGVIGTFLFYFALRWAAANDSKARLFYAVVAVSSLTLNINELFPVNYLLGFALAHSAWKAQGTLGATN